MLKVEQFLNLKMALRSDEESVLLSNFDNDDNETTNSESDEDSESDIIVK